MTHAALPANPTCNLVNYAATAFACAVPLWFADTSMHSVTVTLWMLLAYAAPIIFYEVLVMRTPWRESVGLNFARRDQSPKRLFTKLVGLYGSFGFVALLYWLFPEYHGSFYDPYWDALSRLLPYAAILSVPYMAFMDSRQREPEDSYYHFGRLLLMDTSAFHRVQTTQHLLGWVVKGFFLPLMFVSIVGNVGSLMRADVGTALHDFKAFYRLSVDLLFTIDLLAAVAGYALAIRLLDTHIRSSEPTLFGWFICLMCYQPFLSIYMRYYLAYSGNDWMPWLEGTPILQVAWGSLALALLSVYTLASINFGLRFSNLTHRGVLTGGMYRFTKHPAYVCKNAFWWMVYIPFVPLGGWLEALRFCMLMLAISGVYYLRARTEEAHLSRDPNYVAYALAMNERSVFRRLVPYLPFLRYRAPAGWEQFPQPYQGLK